MPPAKPSDPEPVGGRPKPIGGPPPGAPKGRKARKARAAEARAARSDAALSQDDKSQLEEIRDLLLVRRSSELVDLLTFLKSRKSLALSNFIMGMSRGIGFFLGFTLVGAVIVAMVGFFVDWTAETFSSNYSTRSIVRSVMGKYEEVMDEVARVQGERAAEDTSALPSASGAHLGAVFSLGEGD